MKITEKKYWKEFNAALSFDLKKLADEFDYHNSQMDTGYQTEASAVYSSNIEGNTINLNSFMNYRLSKTKPQPLKELQEIEDLISAYEYAQCSRLTEQTFLKTHKILSDQILIPGLRGKYRTDKVGVFGQSGLVYLAVEAELVPDEMKNFFDEIEVLFSQDISTEEAFYFASMIHLRFVHIHPFRDGNGRAARLLEKWFLAQNAGPQFWKLPSEKYYKEHQQEYYSNINLGVNFYELNYDKCVPFLTMLPQSLM